jgi:hypothetical protein
MLIKKPPWKDQLATVIEGLKNPKDGASRRP